MRTLLRSVAALALLAITLFAADLTGTWEFQVDTDAGSGSPTFTLKQNGEELSGTYSGQLGESKVTGTVKGKEVRLQFVVAPTGENITVVYTGTVESDSKMKGTAQFGPLGSGTWSATKK